MNKQTILYIVCLVVISIFYYFKTEELKSYCKVEKDYFYKECVEFNKLRKFCLEKGLVKVDEHGNMIYELR